MATPGLRRLLLAFGLPMLPASWSQTTLDPLTNNATLPPDSGFNGGLSSEAVVAIAVVFSILGVILLAVVLFLLIRKLREKRQTEGTYRPSSEEQVGARAPPPPNLKLPPEERLI
ncbi:Crb3 [Phodopus roborovskii]|uniref:Crb3 protein n=1 Tax=Phodopus roborovskii TaxID=109678 RepID=A0AAU9YYL6_PHORO|nr:Crb3 [Phodopus roborovskii]